MSEVVLSIDPGLRVVGCAVFVDNRLVACDVVECDYGYGVEQRIEMARAIRTWYVAAHLDELGEPTDVVIEEMQVRRGNDAQRNKRRGDVDADLIKLSHVTGAAWREFDESNAIAAPAGTWTKGRNKQVNHRRILKRLDPPEERALEAGLADAMKDNHKEILDAVGIGLWHIGRLS